MTSSERLRRAYNHETMDRPAVYIYNSTGFPDATYEPLAEYERLNCDLVMRWSPSRVRGESPLEIHASPFSDQYERQEHLLHTPAGDLRGIFMKNLKGFSGIHKSPLINCKEDLEKYLTIPPIRPEDFATDSFPDVQARIGERGIVQVPFGSPAGEIARLCGSENFAILSICERELIHRCCEAEMKKRIAMLQYLFTNNVGPYFAFGGEERIAPPLHSPQDFREFIVKYEQPIIEFIHNNNGVVHMHCHGSIKDIMDDFVTMGVDVLHPIEAPPSGNIPLDEAKTKAGGRVCLEGNIQIAAIYELTAEMLIEQTKKLINTGFSNSQGLIVTGSAPPYIPGEGKKCFENYKAVIDTVLDYRT
jgi:hypothetical protein